MSVYIYHTTVILNVIQNSSPYGLCFPTDKHHVDTVQWRVFGWYGSRIRSASHNF